MLMGNAYGMEKNAKNTDFLNFFYYLHIFKLTQSWKVKCSFPCAVKRLNREGRGEMETENVTSVAFISNIIHPFVCYLNTAMLYKA